MRKLNQDELDLWSKVAATVRKLGALTPFTAPLKPMPEKLFPSKLDLHNLTLHDAYHEVVEFIHSARLAGHKKVQIITGKSGEIRREFPFWIEQLPVRSCVMVSGGGAFDLAI